MDLRFNVSDFTYPKRMICEINLSDAYKHDTRPVKIVTDTLYKSIYVLFFKTRVH